MMSNPCVAEAVEPWSQAVRYSLLTWLINPLTVAYFDHYARPLIEAEMIRGAHVDYAVGVRESLRRFERIAQRATKLRRTGRARFRR
jgi:hypothetical protein